MDAIEALKKIKVLLGMKETVDVTLAEAVLADGRTISYENMEVGSIVNVITEEGETEVLEPGDYVLEDGTEFSIGEGGAIIEKEVEGDDEEDGTEMAEVTDERVAAIETRITAIEEALTEIVNMLTQTTEMSTQLAEVAETVGNIQTSLSEAETKLTELAEAPAATSITERKKIEEKPMSKAEQRIAALEAAKQN